MSAQLSLPGVKWPPPPRPPPRSPEKDCPDPSRRFWGRPRPSSNSEGCVVGRENLYAKYHPRQHRNQMLEKRRHRRCPNLETRIPPARNKQQNNRHPARRAKRKGRPHRPSAEFAIRPRLFHTAIWQRRLAVGSGLKSSNFEPFVLQFLQLKFSLTTHYESVKNFCRYLLNAHPRSFFVLHNFCTGY